MLGFEEYCGLFNDAVQRKETVVMSCTCTVRYSGRAESFLKEGDRLVIVKNDGALLVHQPTGNNAINYMKPGSNQTMTLTENGAIIKSVNMAQKENITIELTKIHFFNSHKLEDGHSIIVSGTEADMSNMLMEKPELIEDGFTPVSREEQTQYGFIDVLGVDNEGVLTVVECKRDKADLSAVTQLRRYVEKIMISKGISDVRGIIAAPKITENAKSMLENWGYSFVSVNPPKYLEEFHKKQKRLDHF